MMDLVDFGPLHILMRDNNFHIPCPLGFREPCTPQAIHRASNEIFLLIQINFAHEGRPTFAKGG
jgi:hypothetical protein